MKFRRGEISKNLRVNGGRFNPTYVVRRVKEVVFEFGGFRKSIFWHIGAEGAYFGRGGVRKKARKTSKKRKPQKTTQKSAKKQWKCPNLYNVKEKFRSRTLFLSVTALHTFSYIVYNIYIIRVSGFCAWFFRRYKKRYTFVTFLCYNLLQAACAMVCNAVTVGVTRPLFDISHITASY